MKKILLLSLFGLLMDSCTKEYYSGAIQYNGTDINYIYDFDANELKMTAEGDAPANPIVIKYWCQTSSTIGEGVLDTIAAIPYENTWRLRTGLSYTLWLMCQEDTIGLGSF